MRRVKAWIVREIARKRDRTAGRRALIASMVDRDWYRTSNPDVAEAGIDPVVHYLRWGHAELRDPNFLFDSRWYLARYPDVAAAGVVPLDHFLEFGNVEHRWPNPIFDTGWYLEKYPDVAAAGTNALAHYFLYGASEQRDPSPLFSTTWYVEQNPDVVALGINPLAHFLEKGRAYKLDPNPWFDTAWFYEQYPEAESSGMNPLAYFLARSATDQLDPHPLFDTRWYLSEYPDVAASGRNPLIDYLQSGGTRAPSALHQQQRFEELLASGNVRSAIRVLDLQDQLLPTDQRHRETRRFPLRSVRSAVEAESKALLAAEDGEFIAPVEPKVAGVSRQAYRGGVTSLPLYVARLRDLRLLAGTRYLFPRDGAVLHDEEAATHLDRTVRVKQSEVWRANGELVLRLTRRFGTRIPAGIHLMGEADTNYFHFLFETLPRLVLAESGDPDPTIPLLVTAGIHRNLREALRLINEVDRPVLELESGVIYSVDELIYPSDTARILDVYDRTARSDEALISLKAMREVRRRILSKAGGDLGATRRLYVRRGQRYRAMVNEHEIEEALLDRGFELVSLDDASLAVQVRLFATAREVVLPTGASVANLLWCAPGTKATILSSDHPRIQHNVWQLVANVAGLDLTIFCGPRRYAVTGIYAVHDDYKVDCDALCRHVDASSPERPLLAGPN